MPGARCQMRGANRCTYARLRRNRLRYRFSQEIKALWHFIKPDMR